MLRIIKPEKLEPIYSWSSHDFLRDLFEERIWNEGIFLEYWENQILNFKFSYIDGVITIYSGEFISDYSEEEVKIFFSSNIKIHDTYSWVKDNVKLEILDTRDINDEGIKEIWKYDYEYSNWNDFSNDELFSKYHEYLIQNSVIVRCLPYDWGSIIKMCCPDRNLRLEEKNYWLNLCLTKLYVDRNY